MWGTPFGWLGWVGLAWKALAGQPFQKVLFFLYKCIKKVNHFDRPCGGTHLAGWAGLAWPGKLWLFLCAGTPFGWLAWAGLAWEALAGQPSQKVLFFF